MNLSEEQINALVPDASALKAGRDLAILSKWQLRSYSDKALWGHRQHGHFVYLFRNFWFGDGIYTGFTN